MEKCEWDPVNNRPAIIDNDQHIGCQNEATFSVGGKKNWHLCFDCAELPHFKRLKAKPLKRSEFSA